MKKKSIQFFDLISFSVQNHQKNLMFKLCFLLGFSFSCQIFQIQIQIQSWNFSNPNPHKFILYENYINPYKRYDRSTRWRSNSSDFTPFYKNKSVNWWENIKRHLLRSHHSIFHIFFCCSPFAAVANCLVFVYRFVFHLQK